MMVGWPWYVWERPEEAAELAKQTQNETDQLFDPLDIDGNGVLKPDELPDPWRPRLVADGVKLPETVTREEFGKLAEAMRKPVQRKPEPRGEEKGSDGKR